MHVYIDGAGYAVTAHGPRADVAAVYGLPYTTVGYARQFTGYSTGTHTVCVAAINVGGGSDQWIGCRNVTIPARVINQELHNPQGNVDFVRSTAAGQIDVGGWAFDRNTTDPIDVHIYVDGVGYSRTTRDTRADVATVYGLSTSTVGFSTTLTGVSSGSHSVCIAAINVGRGDNQWLACRTVAVR